jgi:hypothetical protein
MSDGALQNEMFIDKMNTEDGRTKLAGLSAELLKDRIREEGFLGMILTRKPVSRQDLQVSTKHQGMVKIVQMTDLRTGAMTASFRAQPEVSYFSAPRFEVPFYRINSKRYEYEEIELKSYDFPITDVVMQHISNDVQEIEDRQGLLLFETAVQAVQKKANNIALSTASFGDTTACTAYNVLNKTCVERGKCKSNDVVANSAAAGAAASQDENLIYPLQKDDITKLQKLFIGTGGQGSRLRAEKLLMTDYDHLDFNNWVLSDVGDKIVMETTVDGYKYKQVQGLKFFKTLKTDILRPGNLYAFAPEEYLGGFLQFGKLTFFTDKIRDRYSFEAWEDIGLYVGNVAGVRKLELYACSVDAGKVGSTNGANYQPVAEKDLSTLNNLISEGGAYPQVTTF